MHCSSARVLQVLPPSHLHTSSPFIMPMCDVAMTLYFAPSPPLRGFLPASFQAESNGFQSRAAFRWKNARKPLRSCISSASSIATAAADASMKKKRVVFADARGLALASVRLFSELEDPCPELLQFELSELHLEEVVSKLAPEIKRNGMAGASGRLVLDFAQPSADYLDFRRRLNGNMVSLENCLLNERVLSGTIKVKNLGFEKSVVLRITFDTWKSSTDVECCFLHDAYGGSDTDTFSFQVETPCHVLPHERVEFCISYTCSGTEHWDNNGGSNYRLAHVSSASSWKAAGGFDKDPDHRQEEAERANATVGRLSRYEKRPEVECDLYGSPRIAQGLFPEWQSWNGFKNQNPYY